MTQRLEVERLPVLLEQPAAHHRGAWTWRRRSRYPPKRGILIGVSARVPRHAARGQSQFVHHFFRKAILQNGDRWARAVDRLRRAPFSPANGTIGPES